MFRVDSQQERCIDATKRGKQIRKFIMWMFMADENKRDDFHFR
jgi:hypothetical protein